MGDPIKEFYEGVLKSQNMFSTETAFRDFLKDSTNQKDFFGFAKDKGYFSDESEYSNYFGFKKKDQSVPTSKPSIQTPTDYSASVPSYQKPATKKSAQSSQAPSPDFPSTYVSPYESEVRKEKTNEFSTLEGTISDFQKYDNEASGVEMTSAFRPLGTVDFSKSKTSGAYKKTDDPMWFEKHNAALAAVSNNTKEVNKAADDIIQHGGGLTAFISDEDGFTFKKDKAIDLTHPYVQQKGGDNFVTETVVNEIRKKVEGQRDAGTFQKFLSEEYTKRGIDLGKQRDSLLNTVVQPKIAAMKDVEKERDAKIEELATVYKAEAKPLGDQYKAGVKSIQEAYSAGTLSKDDADAKLNELNIDYKQAGDQLFNAYKKKGEGVMTKLGAKYERTYNEMRELEKSSQGYQAIVNSLSEEERKKVEDAYKSAEARIGTYRNEVNKVKDKTLLATSKAGWLSKVTSNTWNGWAADMGDYLSLHDVDGSIVRWAQGRRTRAGETTMGQFSWSENPLMRAITTTTSTIVHPSTVVGLATAWAGGGLGLPSIVTTVVGGTAAFEMETKQQAGQSGMQQFEKTGNIVAGIEGAHEMEQNLQILRPLYFLSSVADQMLIKKGLATKLAATGVEVLEEYPTEIKQQYEQYKMEGGTLGISGFVKENPSMLADIGVGILGQSAVVGGATHAIQKIYEDAPAVRMQIFADMIQKGSVEYAMTNLKSQWQTGQISQKEFQEQTDQLLNTASQLGKIKKLGLSEEDQKAFMAIGENHLTYSKLASKEKNPVIKQIYSIQAKQAEKLMLGIANGTGVYAQVTLPGGGNVSVTMPVEKLTDEVIRSADKIEVKNNPVLNDEVQKRKQAMGNPENVPEGFYENEKKEEVKEVTALTPAEELNKQAGKKIFSTPAEYTRTVSNDYKKSVGINTSEGKPILAVDVERSKEIADAYENMQHNPNDPEVKAAYEAMAKETMDQYDAVKNSGVTFEIYEGVGEPYKSSEEMIKDVRDNKHLYILSTEKDFGTEPITDTQRSENPLLKDSGVVDINGKPLLVNDVFRGVHDFFGHTERGNSFGLIGEENAWDVHARMFTPVARRAMTSETRGQNSWVNSGKHMRNADGSIKKKGDEGYLNAKERPFASQKIGLLPEKYSTTDEELAARPSPEDELRELFDSEINAKVDKVQQALESTGINVKLISDKEMSDVEGLNETGVDGLFTSEDGTIYLNRDRLRKSLDAGTAIYHEGTHPIINIIKNTQPELYNNIVAGLKEIAKTNKDVAKVQKWVENHYADYSKEEQEDEFVVETIGRMANGDIDINKVDKGFLNSLYELMKSIGRLFGIKPKDMGENIATFKTLAQNISDALVGGKDIASIVGAENVKEYQVGVQSGEPRQLRISEADGEDVKVEEDYKLSFVTKKDIVDVKSIIKDIQDNNKKVWFWVGDQLGRGQYFDDVINGEHYLDAGASYALDPKNRNKGIIWASGMAKKSLDSNIKKSDYIFIISGSPATSKLFNKQVAKLVFNRIEKEGSFDKFKSDILAVSKVKPINNILNEFNSFDELMASPKRKEFLNQINDQRGKNTPLKKTLEKYNAFVDYSELADDFYRNNDFKQNDIMLILKPTGVGGTSDHSTYENDILGEVVGVPDKKINAFDLMDEETRIKHAELSRAQQSQVVAPYGSGVKGISKAQARRSTIEDDKNFKLTTYVFKKKSEGLSDAEIAASILSVFPDMDMNEVKELVSDPSTYLNKKFAYLSPAVRANIVARAMVKDVYKATTSIDPAFSKLEVSDKSVEEATKKGRGVRKIKDYITSFKNTFLDPARGLPDWTMAMRDFATGEKNLEVIKSENVIKRLQKEAKKIGFTDWDNFSEAMKNLAAPMQSLGVNNVPVIFDPIRAAYNKPLDMPPAIQHPSLAALPASIKPFVFEMRAQIDRLTNELITSGYVTPEQAIALENNLGAYVNRSYKAYNEKPITFLGGKFGGYTPTKADFNAAVKIIGSKKLQQIASQDPTMDLAAAEKQATEEATREVNAILDSKSSPYFGTSNKLDARNTGILKEKQDIPEHIRKLLGEYTDPGTVFIMTVAKQAALVAASQYLGHMRTMGMGTLFFEKNDPNRPMDYSVEVAGEGSESKSPLSGLYTTPDIKAALEHTDPTYNSLANAWMKIVGATRWGKTVGSIVTQFKNFESNFGFMIMNGLWLTGKNAEAFGSAGDYFKGQWSDKEISALTEKVNKLGLVGQSIGVRELSDMFKTGNIHAISLDRKLNPKSKWKMAEGIVGIPFKFANKMYRLGDDFFKVYAYVNESRQIANALYGTDYDKLTAQQQEDVDIEAAERVKNTFPTYDRVVELAKTFSKNVPIFGNFLSFQAESVRVLQNSVRYAVNDVKSDNKGFQAMGAKRLAGIGAYLAFRTAVTLGVAKLAGIAGAGILGSIMGDDDEERKKEGMKQALPPWMRTGDLLIIPGKEKGTFTVFNLSSVDPYGTVFNTLNAYTEGSSAIVDQSPGVTAAMSEFIGTFVSPEMTFKTMWSALVEGEDPKTGRKINTGDEHGFEYAMNIGGAMWNTLEPSTISLTERLIEKDDKLNELGAVAGARAYDVDLNKSFRFLLTNAGKALEDINGNYYRNAYKAGNTPEQIEEYRQQADTQASYVIDKMNRTRENFILLGADASQLEEMILLKSPVKATGINPNVKDGMLGGNYERGAIHKTVEPEKNNNK